MTLPALALVAVLVWVVAVAALIRFLSVFHQQVLRSGMGSRTLERLNQLEEHSARESRLTGELSRKVEQSAEQTRAALEEETHRLEQYVHEHVREAGVSLTTPLLERIARLEASLDEIRALAGGGQRVEALQGTVNDMGKAMSDLTQQLAGLPDAIRQTAGPKGDTDAMAGRLDRLEETADRLAKRRQDTTGAVEKSLKDLQKQFDELRGSVQQQLEPFSGVGETAGNVEALEQQVRELAEEVSALRTNIPEQEPPAAGSRINALSEQQPEVRAAGGQPGASAGRRAPRMISAAGRERYEEVLALWTEGRSVEQIAIMTGLDVAEIELMVAGETPQSGPS